MQRRAFLGSRLCQKNGSERNIEGRKTDLARDHRSAFPPFEPARNHEMEDEKELTFELPHDSLADTPESRDKTALDLIERRFDRAEEKRRREPHAFEHATLDARAERRK